MAASPVYSPAGCSLRGAEPDTTAVNMVLAAHLIPAIKVALGGEMADVLDDMVNNKSLKHGAPPTSCHQHI